MSLDETGNVEQLKKQELPYSSKFSWHNISVNFVIDPSFTNFFIHENLISEGVAFLRAERVMHLH